MRFSVASVFAGLLAVVSAQDVVPFDPIYTPNAYQEVPAGSVFTITWDHQPAIYDNEFVSLTLIGGAEQNTQVPLYQIASGIRNSDGKYEWNVRVDEFGKNFYGIVIALESNKDVFQYSNPFKVVAAPGAATTTTTTSDEPLPTGTGVPDVTNTISLSSVVTETSTICTETTSTFSAEAVPTHGYVPAPDTHNNGTASLVPATTLTQATVAHTDSTPVPTTVPSPVPTGGAVAHGVSMALVGAAAIFAFAF
jgi:hypothetical protein